MAVLVPAVLLAASAAHATPLPFAVYENASNASLTGFSITMNVSPFGTNAVDLTFTNASSGINSTARVDDLYIENTTFAAASFNTATIVAESAGVNFEPPATPGNPGGSLIPAYAGTFASFGRDGPGGNALNVGESLTIRVTLKDGATPASVANAFLVGAVRVFSHTQALNNGQFSVFTRTIPAPAAAATLALGGLMAARRRR